MATVTLTSTCDSNLSQTLAYENSNSPLREASFSSYLSSAEENFIIKLAESTGDPSPTITAPKDSQFQISLARMKSTGREISVFSAEKYFNGGMDEGELRISENVARNHQSKKDEQTHLHRLKPKIRPGTPTTCSEVSWNSQSSLLPSLFRDQSKQNRVLGKGFFANFGCNCSCSDKKSVDINENDVENKNSRSYKSIADCGGVHSKEIITKEPIKIDQKQTQFKDLFCQEFEKVSFGSNRESHFAFPVVSSGAGNPTVKRQIEEQEEEENEKPRKSLDVFGSPIIEKGDRNSNPGRRLSMLTWDAIPRAEDIPANSSSRGAYEDIESDASSDLFEIESFSSKAHPYFSRQASDGMSSCVNYEPSEASVDWSVVTGSAPNFSTASESGEQGPAAVVKNTDGMILTSTTTAGGGAKSATAKEVQRRRPSMLSSCRSHKAVTVAGNAYMMAEKAKASTPRRHRSDSFAPIGRFQAESRVIDLESAHAQRAFATRSLPCSNSARAPHSMH